MERVFEILWHNLGYYSTNFSKSRQPSARAEFVPYPAAKKNVFQPNRLEDSYLGLKLIIFRRTENADVDANLPF